MVEKLLSIFEKGFATCRFIVVVRYAQTEERDKK